jgi:hypothetical protein
MKIPLGNLYVNKGIILKWILNRMLGFGLDSCSSKQDPLKGSCEHSNGLFRLDNGVQFRQLSVYEKRKPLLLEVMGCFWLMGMVGTKKIIFCIRCKVIYLFFFIFPATFVLRIVCYQIYLEPLLFSQSGRRQFSLSLTRLQPKNETSYHSEAWK